MTPTVATTVHHLAVRNEPMRMRNSPEKPLRPGTPMELSITTVNTAASTGAERWSPLRAEISRVWRRS